MREEQKNVAIYTVFGISMGLLSGFLLKKGLGCAISLILPFPIYISLTLFLKRKFKSKKFLADSFITFILVWVTSWLLIYNL